MFRSNFGQIKGIFWSHKVSRWYKYSGDNLRPVVDIRGWLYRLSDLGVRGHGNHGSVFSVNHFVAFRLTSISTGNAMFWLNCKHFWVCVIGGGFPISGQAAGIRGPPGVVRRFDWLTVESRQSVARWDGCDVRAPGRLSGCADCKVRIQIAVECRVAEDKLAVIRFWIRIFWQIQIELLSIHGGLVKVRVISSEERNQRDLWSYTHWLLYSSWIHCLEKSVLSIYFCFVRGFNFCKFWTTPFLPSVLNSRGC